MSNFQKVNSYSKKYNNIDNHLDTSEFYCLCLVNVISIGNFEIKKCFLSFDPESQ